MRKRGPCSARSSSTRKSWPPAARLAKLSEQLERAGHAPDVVAQFLMRCLFTMFSEDVNLIPKTW